MTKNIVIIGGSHAGSQAAASLRTDGFDGKITLISSERELPYHRPPLSKAFIKADEGELQELRPAAFYEKNAIELLLGRTVTAIDRVAGLVRLDDGDLPFDGLVLATGARVRVPPVHGIDLDNVFMLRTADDARRLKARFHEAQDVVVVGGGFIGLELASTARLLGKTVTVLEAAPRLMGRAVAPAISAHFLELHRGWGSTIRLETPVAGLVGENGAVVAVETLSGERIPADTVIVGVGVVPNIELAEAAELEVANGIVVDATMATADPRIVAAGDAVSFHHWALGRPVRLESVQNAVDQAKTAAATLLGKPEPYKAVPWFWSDQGDAKLQMVGLLNDADRSVLRGKPEDGSFSVFHYKGDKLVAIDSVNRATDHMLGRRWIGAGASPAPESVADESVDLKKLVVA
ncbi:FAD-dependent oxidoreductase [Kaistia dalseonensis]|uniref:3-phenylpropionate/trans-cinnamate dioxygenase ferredoxin reductase subunit n=1 Tax=Kaistia dalseonensis TaxID=410840 RepID=A0ABU0HBY8_9HYPH|nr:FAD-dependent oxidoreductase [Kaistia dalseonensis]MCX5497185.1 FAD-dependent oxidoreductase [Kaistia dalseonensis]MDQ0439816.1 3-phenylpropionate/trans-cinnamate dioxygenase ferredoxin reductase subunit [Kaistia dalseonensis]